MARPTAMDEQFVHQLPQLLPQTVVHHEHWRESYFFELHDPTASGDVVFFTMATTRQGAHGLAADGTGRR